MRWPLCLSGCVIREYVQFLNKQVISEKGSRVPEKGKSVFRDGLKDPVRQGRMVVKSKFRGKPRSRRDTESQNRSLNGEQVEDGVRKPHVDRWTD